jgi:hypothetical protein
MATTDLTILIRPPFDEEVDQRDLLRRAEALNLQPVLPIRSPEILLACVRRVCFGELLLKEATTSTR